MHFGFLNSFLNDSSPTLGSPNVFQTINYKFLFSGHLLPMSQMGQSRNIRNLQFHCHDSFCDSIIRYVMIAIPITTKIPGTIFSQILGIRCPKPKSTNISKSAIIPTTAAIRHIKIDFIFWEFAISFSILTSSAFKFD